MVSQTAPTEQSLVTQKRIVATFAAWAGVCLVLATINGGLSIVARRGCACGIETWGNAFLTIIILELLYTFGKCIFAFAGGMLGLEVALLLLLFLVADPNPADFSFWVFGLFWLGFGVEFVFDPIAGAVDRVMATRLRR
ncbi:hypothetical protein PG996_003270 [Apiospora saccharicola]|uniref:Uncharacterized protein n=1 Tax=Apiospora saccharicola TaxID=335842 RepID=A0ABR1W0U6_9PEZI